eukprot:TRINITY_DN58708_c0_g1_i1.p1 TRINITY_DN58708_c0_g1~~TRINITY_DN58708_c0_g1_i1.p1  ORF type:complete len:487 (+),score=78.78 TRINITY_DN58708_c0_g1_i1:55-1461(+)
MEKPRFLQGIIPKPVPKSTECENPGGCETCGHVDCNVIIVIVSMVVFLVYFAGLIWCCFFHIGPRDRSFRKRCHTCIASGHQRELNLGTKREKCDLCQTETGTKHALERCKECEVNICMNRCRQPVSRFCRQQLEHIYYRTTWAHKAFDGMFTCSSCRSVKKTSYSFHRCDVCRVNFCNRCVPKHHIEPDIYGKCLLKSRIPPPYKFHYFLSYKKSHSRLSGQPEGFVTAMHDELKSFGLHGFFDVRSTKDVRMEKVQECATIIVYLHDETLHSASCQQELQYATWEEMPMVCVFDEDNFNEADLYATYKNAGGLLTDCPWIGISVQNLRPTIKILAEWLQKSTGNTHAKEEVARAALRQAAAEGLTLVRTRRNETGFAGVTPDSEGGFAAVAKDQRGKQVSLGVFKTAEEAALASARLLGPAGSLAAAKAEEEASRRFKKDVTDRSLVAMTLNVPGTHFKTDAKHWY